jgi:hypothetical protein
MTVSGEQLCIQQWRHAVRGRPIRARGHRDQHRELAGDRDLSAAGRRPSLGRDCAERKGLGELRRRHRPELAHFPQPWPATTSSPVASRFGRGPPGSTTNQIDLAVSPAARASSSPAAGPTATMSTAPRTCASTDLSDQRGRQQERAGEALQQLHALLMVVVLAVGSRDYRAGINDDHVLLLPRVRS